MEKGSCEDLRWIKVKIIQKTLTRSAIALRDTLRSRGTMVIITNILNIIKKIRTYLLILTLKTGVAQ